MLDVIPLTRYNERTVCTKAALRKEFKKIRELGYATDVAEQYEGCHCVGAAIRDHRDYPIGMIWASGPSVNLTEERFKGVGELIKEGAALISHKFGNHLV